jgi:hypothetical protein
MNRWMGLTEMVSNRAHSGGGRSRGGTILMSVTQAGVVMCRGSALTLCCESQFTEDPLSDRARRLRQKRQRDTALILLNPVLLALIASALHLYPFTGRVISFLLPIVLLATAAGADYVLNHWPQRPRSLSTTLLGVIVGSPLYAIATALPPERTEHLRPVLKTLAKRRQPNDDVYVYYGAGQSFMYYAPRSGLERARFVLGQSSSTDLRVYLREMDRYRGRPRLWIVATHARSGATDLLMIIGYLETIGRQLETIEERAILNLPSIGAYGLLFDLSNERRFDRRPRKPIRFPKRRQTTALHDGDATERSPLQDGFDPWTHSS